MTSTENHTKTHQTRLDIPMIWGKDSVGNLKPFWFLGCTADNLPHLEKLFSELNNVIAEISLYMTFPNKESYYVNDERIKAICNEILILNGINPVNHNVSQIAELCIGDAENTAILLQLNFISDSDKPTKNTDEHISLLQYIAKLEGDLIASKLLTASEVRELLATKPLDYVISMFESLLDDKKDNKSNNSPTEPISFEEFDEMQNSDTYKEKMQQAIFQSIRK